MNFRRVVRIAREHFGSFWIVLHTVSSSSREKRCIIPLHTHTNNKKYKRDVCYTNEERTKRTRGEREQEGTSGFSNEVRRVHVCIRVCIEQKDLLATRREKEKKRKREKEREVALWVGEAILLIGTSASSIFASTVEVRYALVFICIGKSVLA